MPEGAGSITIIGGVELVARLNALGSPAVQVFPSVDVTKFNLPPLDACQESNSSLSSGSPTRAGAALLPSPERVTWVPGVCPFGPRAITFSVCLLSVPVQAIQICPAKNARDGVYKLEYG